MTGAVCPWPGCQHAVHAGQCRARDRSRCIRTVNLQTGEPGGGIVCFRGPRPECPCPFERCRCGVPVAVAQLIPGGSYLPVERGSAGTGSLEVWILQGAMYVRELAHAETSVPLGRWRGTSHLLTCARAADWAAERAQWEQAHGSLRSSARL